MILHREMWEAHVEEQLAYNKNLETLLMHKLNSSEVW